MATTATAVSRLALAHPDFQHDGGAGLHTKVRDAWTKIGDNSASRFFTSDALANGASVDLVHNFKCSFTELSALLYSHNTGTGEITRLDETTTPKLSEFSIGATPGSEITSIRVTNNSGSARDIALIVNQDGGDGQRSFTVANNQAATALAGLSFVPTKFKAAHVPFDLHRETSSTVVDEVGSILISYDSVNALWRLSVDSKLDNAGVTFTMNGNQLEYASTNIAGTSYAGSLRIGKIVYINL